MIRDAKERTKRIDSAEGNDNSLIKKVAPQGNDDGAGQKNAGHPAGAAKGLPDAATQSLDHKAPHPRPHAEHRQHDNEFENDAQPAPSAGRGSPPMVLAEYDS